MNFLNTKLGRVLAATVIAAGLIGGVTVVANAASSSQQQAVKPDCTHPPTVWPLCPRSVGNGQLVDHVVTRNKIPAADVNAYLKDTNTPDVKGDVVVNKSFDPATVEKIGGKFADNATVVGKVTIPAGAWKIDADGFWTTLAAGPDGTRPQLALRDAAGHDLGTIFPGEASPAKDREITGHSTKVATFATDTTVTVYAFGYNDDASAAGAGRLQVTASVVATRG